MGKIKGGVSKPVVYNWCIARNITKTNEGKRHNAKRISGIDTPFILKDKETDLVTWLPLFVLKT
jgi:hypothetical protein